MQASNLQSESLIKKETAAQVFSWVQLALSSYLQKRDNFSKKQWVLTRYLYFKLHKKAIITKTIQYRLAFT